MCDPTMQQNKKGAMNSELSFAKHKTAMRGEKLISNLEKTIEYNLNYAAAEEVVLTFTPLINHNSCRSMSFHI